MDDLTNQITLLRTEINLTQDPEERAELTKKMNVLLLKKEIETIKTRIAQMS